MPSRILHFRIAFAAIAVATLVGGALAESVWLAAPGVAAALVSEGLGLAQARARFREPVERALRGGAESLPAVGVAAYEPWALGVTVAIVVYALLANGFRTVMTARGVTTDLQRGETLRRVLCSMAGISLLWIPLDATTNLYLGGRLGTSPAAMAVVASAIAALAGARALLDMWLSLRGE
jgi:hypothetical protein